MTKEVSFTLRVGAKCMSPFGTLQVLREKSIPAPTPKSGYRDMPIDVAGAANAEPLVRTADYGIAGKNFYASTRNPPYYHVIPGSIDVLMLREGAAKRLQAVNAKLAEADLELFVFDAWRPQAVQIYFHDIWLPNDLKRRRPDLTGEALTAEVETYWAAPSNGANAPSPHATGGAVDLTLRWKDGDQLWMGSLFDDASPIAHTAHFEGAAPDAAFSFSAEEARANRRLLYWLMREADFASNPSEWWHFSYGDQMWAQTTGAPAALYSDADYTP
jgi:D-alanyl-D-alanine dipeptidase